MPKIGHRPALSPAIIPRSDPLCGSTGGIRHFADVFKNNPTVGFILYHRVSSREQGGKHRAKLEAKTNAIFAVVEKLAGNAPIKTFCGVEEGRLSTPRQTLVRACELATAFRPMGLVVVAADLSRFIRSEVYDRRKNPEAVPTLGEFAQLRDLTRGANLATLLPPSATDSERHRASILRGGAAGRPRVIDDETACAIFERLGYKCFGTDRRGWRYRDPLRGVAISFGVSPNAIYHAMARPCPHLQGTWDDWLLDNAVKMKLMERGENGEWISHWDSYQPKRGRYGKRGRPPTFLR
jgi:hypothetical protein